MDEHIFALDIGTRSVVGILLKKNEESYDFVDIECLEHPERAMLNGQIHNAPLVSKVIGKVRENLEKRNGIILNKTSIAAAGRSLITRQESMEERFPEDRVVTKEDITRLKLSCVHKSQNILKTLETGKDFNNYYCVGYSVTKNFLDDIELGNLEGQKGKKIAVEIVAAFLPKIVLESLKYVVEDNGLHMQNLTLEPIAAINAIIPSTMRKLNLALVDIGAGTSDIAISSEGAINAYGMVPMAGDEVTEKISSDLILDFNEAERIKRKISDNEEIEYTDVLGFTNIVLKEELLAVSEPVSAKVAEEIVKTILLLNGKSPQAVVLIGGGSLTPGIRKKIAHNLELPENRVAVQSARSIIGVNNLPEKYQGPEFITPIGIALTDRNDSNLGFIQVKVNDQTISVLNLGANTIFDALLSAGIESGKIYSKPGLSKTIRINGKIKIIPGTMGSSSEIYLNGEKAKIDDFIKAEDSIRFIAGKDGQEGNVFLKEFIPPEVKVIFDFQEMVLPFEILVSGEITHDYEQELRDNENVSVRVIDTIGEFAEKIDRKYLETINFNISIDNNVKFKFVNLYEYRCNEQKVSIDYKIKEGDWIEAVPKNEEEFKIKNIISEYLDDLEKKYITVIMDDNPVKIAVADFEIYHNNNEADFEEFVCDGDYINIKRRDLKKPLLIDLFKEINFYPKAPEGKTKVEVLLNGEEAEYISPIKDGDHISIVWR